jgi:hypothetical protein
MKNRRFNARIALQGPSRKSITLVLMIVAFAGCSTQSKISGPPFGRSVTEDRIIRGIVARLENHGSYRFTYSGEIVDGDDPRLALPSLRPAEGHAKTDLSLWWARRFAHGNLPEPRDRAMGWTMMARF